MKIKYLIGFSVLCLVSLVSIFVLLHTDVEAFNRDFGIEILYGNDSILKELRFSNIIQETPNSFTRVTLSTDGPIFEPTNFDTRHSLNEEQLEHRELYRHIDNRKTFENEDIKVVHHFSNNAWNRNRDASVRINILDKQTGEVSNINHTFDRGIRNLSEIWDTFLIENNDGLYYVLPGQESLRFTVYYLDIENMALEYKFSFENKNHYWGNWFATQNGVYFHPENSDNNQDSQLYVIDFSSGNMELITIDGHIGWWSLGSYRNISAFENSVFDEESEEWIDVINVVDMQTGKSHQLTNPFHEHVDANDRRWTSNNHNVIGNYLVLNYIMDNLQFIVIYDLINLELVFTGRTRLRNDQGLMTNWGVIQGFNVSLRD